MLEAGEVQATSDALRAARSTLDGIEVAYRKWRNALSYLGNWAEDAATTSARLLAEAAASEYRALENMRAELEASPLADHEAAIELVARARALAASDAARKIEALGRGSNWSAIVAGEASDAIHGVGDVATAVVKETGDQLARPLGALPWWIWPAAGVAALVMFAPPIVSLVSALVASRRRG